jgi:hypothetical protein|tara:strand:+ start:135 stop:482 length:348 start_codon:yes stop_codon:yes gene_type:complete
MKNDGSNIIPFPVKDKFSVEEYDLETTHHIFNIVSDELEELGYDIDNMQSDIAVLANLLYASFQREHKHNEHIFHFVLDECSVMIQAAKDYMNELQLKQDNELNDGEPSNDNNRL